MNLYFSLKFLIYIYVLRIIISVINNNLYIIYRDILYIYKVTKEFHNKYSKYLKKEELFFHSKSINKPLKI